MTTPEDATYDRLRETCRRNSSEVFAKVRLADVLPIESSGIADDLFRFALQSHFDFVIADLCHLPLFGVEFDGPSHAQEPQVFRDSKKKLLCERFQFPLLRVNAAYLNRSYRNLDLLTWFVETWFCAKGFEEAQRTGQIPLDEPFDPCTFLSIPGLQGHFPLWLSSEPMMKLRQLAEAGKCEDAVPDFVIGIDNDGIYRGVEHLRVNKEAAIITYTAMRSQYFPVSEVDAIHEILPFQTHQLLLDVLNGDERPRPVAEVKAAAQGFSKYVRPILSGSSG